MTKLPGAKPSPRIAGGVLRWYAGDTFSVTLALELRDQDGETVSVGASDSETLALHTLTSTKNAPACSAFIASLLPLPQAAQLTPAEASRWFFLPPHRVLHNFARSAQAPA